MESQAIAICPVEGDAAGPSFTTGSPLPLDIQSFFAQNPDDCNMEDLLRLDESTGQAPPDLQFAGDTSHSTIDGLPQPVQQYPVGLAVGATVGTGVENQREQNAHACFDDFDWTTGISPGLIIGQQASGNAAFPTAAPLHFNVQEVNAALIPTAADTGSSSLDLEVNTGAGLSQTASGGGGGAALTEAAVRGSSKRKKLVCGSSSQRSTPPEFNLLQLEAGLVRQSDPCSLDIKPADGSTDPEIMLFLMKESRERGLSWAALRAVLRWKAVNHSVAKEDQNAPEADRSYVTTALMEADQKTHLGYWTEKKYELVNSGDLGLKKTWQFHKCDGTKTNWFMDEYISTDSWGSDLYMERLRFRVVYKDAAISVPGDPTSPEVKIKNKIAAAKRHRMRGPENLIIRGESPVWQHFIKIYDRHPKLEGSKVVYAVCCHCKGVLKAGTDNGTKSLLNHCDRTCPVKNKNQEKGRQGSSQKSFWCPVGFL